MIALARFCISNSLRILMVLLHFLMIPGGSFLHLQYRSATRILAPASVTVNSIEFLVFPKVALGSIFFFHMRRVSREGKGM